MALQQPLQPLPLVAIPADRCVESSRPDLEPCLHVATVAKLGQDHYAKCHCRPDAVSLAFTSVYYASRWTCPFEEAEQVSARNVEMFRRRMAVVFDAAGKAC